MRKGIWKAVCALALTTWFSGGAIAQSYPNRPVKIVVPFSAGGVNDVIARVIAQELSLSGKNFYVENMAGGGGNIGIAFVSRADPDGYTLLITSTGFVVNPALFSNLRYNAQSDFIAISKLASTPNVIAVASKDTPNSIRDLVEQVTATPGKYSYAHPGVGSTPQLTGELFRRHFNLDFPGVAFSSSGPAITATLGAHTLAVFTSLPPAVPLIKSKELKALAVTGAKRSQLLPDVPTLVESGAGDIVSDTWVGVWAPKGTSVAIIQYLHSEIAKALAKPEVRARLAELAFEPVGNSPAEFASEVVSDLTKWRETIGRLGLPKVN